MLIVPNHSCSWGLTCESPSFFIYNLCATFAVEDEIRLAQHQPVSAGGAVKSSLEFKESFMLIFSPVLRILLLEALRCVTSWTYILGTVTSLGEAISASLFLTTSCVLLRYLIKLSNISFSLGLKL